MRCSSCGAENSAGSRFCNQCATPLAKTCPKCGAENAPDAKFCSQCAASLDAAAADSRANELSKAGSTGERRHLTVLFCDLVGSTEIAAQLDPEDWREVVDGYHRVAAEAITRFGGYVAQYLGDGVMAYFGWPEAHDNDGERATRAGLAILGALSKLNEQTGPASARRSSSKVRANTRPKLSARVGIDSGVVVVGAGAGKEIDVFGETPNIAARVQAAAAPDALLLTASTHRLVSGLFVVEERGAQKLKALSTQ